MSNDIPQNLPGASITSLPSDVDLSSLSFRDVSSPPPGNLEGHTVVQIPSTTPSKIQEQQAWRNIEARGEARFNSIKGKSAPKSREQPIEQPVSSLSAKAPTASASKQQQEKVFQEIEAKGEGKINEGLRRLSRVPFQTQSLQPHSNQKRSN